MLPKKLRLTLLISSWVLASCTHAPPDFMACADLGDSGHCVTYVTKKKSDVAGTDWNKLRAGSVLMPSAEFVKLKTWFDNYCHQNTCPNGVGDWNSFANELDSSLKK
jgi:hypothetical protein